MPRLVECRDWFGRHSAPNLLRGMMAPAARTCLGHGGLTHSAHCWFLSSHCPILARVGFRHSLLRRRLHRKKTRRAGNLSQLSGSDFTTAPDLSTSAPDDVRIGPRHLRPHDGRPPTHLHRPAMRLHRPPDTSASAPDTSCIGPRHKSIFLTGGWPACSSES